MATQKEVDKKHACGILLQHKMTPGEICNALSLPIATIKEWTQEIEEYWRCEV